LSFPYILSSLFFFNDTATTEIYTLSLHDALPISGEHWFEQGPPEAGLGPRFLKHKFRDLSYTFDYLEDLSDLAIDVNHDAHPDIDRKSTRLNSSHVAISYAVFCLKKKKKKKII